MKSVWHYNTEFPREGSKIEYVETPKIVEVDVWKDDNLVNNPGDWPKVKLWRYIDEFYSERMKNEQGKM